MHFWRNLQLILLETKDINELKIFYPTRRQNKSLKVSKRWNINPNLTEPDPTSALHGTIHLYIQQRSTVKEDSCFNWKQPAAQIRAVFYFEQQLLIFATYNNAPILSNWLPSARSINPPFPLNKNCYRRAKREKSLNQAGNSNDYKREDSPKNR